MWEEYAENHQGIMLRIEPNVARDSKFQLFRQVEYCDSRPPFYHDVLDFVAGGLFGDQEARRRASVEKVIYTKTLKWAHENEYRLAIALRTTEEPWDVVKFHPEEATELYLGLATTPADKENLTKLAMALNPNIAIFQAIRSPNDTLTFEKIG